MTSFEHHIRSSEASNCSAEENCFSEQLPWKQFIFDINYLLRVVISIGFFSVSFLLFLYFSSFSNNKWLKNNETQVAPVPPSISTELWLVTLTEIANFYCDNVDNVILRLCSLIESLFCRQRGEVFFSAENPLFRMNTSCFLLLFLQFGVVWGTRTDGTDVQLHTCIDFSSIC